MAFSLNNMDKVGFLIIHVHIYDIHVRAFIHSRTRICIHAYMIGIHSFSDISIEPIT